MLRRHFMTNNEIVPDIIITYTAMQKICDIPVGYEIYEDLEGIYGNRSNDAIWHKYRLVINNYDDNIKLGTIGLKILSIGEPSSNNFITEKLLTSGTRIFSILKNGSGNSVKSSLNNHNKNFGYMSWNGSINNIIDCAYFADFDNRNIYISNISISEGVELISGLVTPSIIEDIPYSPLGINIKLPSTLKAIGVGAFFGVANVPNIIIPRNVRYICAGAFAACRSDILMTPLNPPKIDTIFGEKYPENDYGLNYLHPNLDNGDNVYYDKEANIKLFNYNIDNYKNDEKWKDHIDRMSECDTYFYAQSIDPYRNVLDLVRGNIIKDEANEYCFYPIDQVNTHCVIINTKITNNNNIYLNNNNAVEMDKCYINNRLMTLIVNNIVNDNYLKILIIKNISKINAGGNYTTATNYNKLLHFEYDVEYAVTNGNYYAFGFNNISTFIIGEHVKYLPKYFVQFHDSALPSKYLTIPDNVEMIDDNCFDISTNTIFDIQLSKNLKYVGDNIFCDILGSGGNYFTNLRLHVKDVADDRLDFLANLKNASNGVAYKMFTNKSVNLYINGKLANNRPLYIGVNPKNRSLNCLNLTGCAINFLSNVDTIGDETFASTKCSNLYLTNIKHIGNYIHLQSDKTILSDSIEFIGNEAFAGTKSIEGDVKNLPNLDYVGWRAFSNELEEQLNLGEGIIYLGNTLYKQKGVLENNTLICKEGIKYVNLDIDPSIENIVLPKGIVKINLLDMGSFKETQFYKNQPDNEPIYIGKYYICFKGSPTEYNGTLIKDNTILTADRSAETRPKSIKLNNFDGYKSNLVRLGDYSLREFYIDSSTHGYTIPNSVNLGENSIIYQKNCYFDANGKDGFYEKNAIHVDGGIVTLSNSSMTSLNSCVNLYNVETLLLPRTLEKIAIDDFRSYNGKTSIKINNTTHYWFSIEKEDYWDTPFRKYKNELTIECSDGTAIYNFIEDSVGVRYN